MAGAFTKLWRGFKQVAGTTGLLVQRSGSGETADLQGWTDENGAPLLGVNSQGQFYAAVPGSPGSYIALYANAINQWGMQGLALTTSAGLTFPDTSKQTTAFTGVSSVELPFGEAPSGAWHQPSNMSAAAANAVTAGVVSYVPFDVGAVHRNYTNLGINVTTAQVGGSASLVVGVYPDDGSGSMPNLVGGPVITTTFATLTTSGVKSNAITWNPSTPGRYWMAALYLVATAPTTAPQFNCVSNVGSMLFAPTTPGGVGRCLESTGQSALPTTQITVNSQGANTGIVVAALAGSTVTTYSVTTKTAVTVYAPGTSTYTILGGCLSLSALAVGASGGSGSGAIVASGTACSGGAAGGSGGWSYLPPTPVSLLGGVGANITAVVGAGGTGGVARTAGTVIAGQNGGAGGNTTFGALKAGGGAGGVGGQSAAAAAGGVGGTGQIAGVTGASGVNGAAGGNGGATVTASGGAGGGITTGAAAAGGGTGGVAGSVVATAAAAGGANGGAGSIPMAGYPGTGGGGGGAFVSASTLGGIGGTAGGNGSGGGGGGSVLTTGGNSGAGATGGAGYLIVTAYF